MDITEVDIPTIKVVGIKKTGSYKDIAKMISRVFSYVLKKGVQPSGPPVYLCHETSEEAAKKAMAEEKALLEVALPVSEDVEVSDDFRLYEIPGGRMAKIIHKGPYHEVGSTYHRLFDWVNRNRKSITGLLREYYISDPNETPPEEIITEIYAPIE